MLFLYLVTNKVSTPWKTSVNQEYWKLHGNSETGVAKWWLRYSYSLRCIGHLKLMDKIYKNIIIKMHRTASKNWKTPKELKVLTIYESSEATEHIFW